jgi:hypothetical protein
MRFNRKIIIRLPEDLFLALKALDTNMSKFLRQAAIEKIKKIKKAS